MSETYAVVVGAVNMDIWGRSDGPLVMRDSNPGEMRFSFGGVGRNIARNMALLGMNVQMLTALGGDAWAAQIEADCRACGIGLDRAIRAPEARTGSYLYITGPDGDMALAVCDQDIARYITPEAIEKNLDLLNRAELVVFDGNLTQEAMDCLCSRCTVPLFVDPVSASKAKKLIPFLGRLHTIKPNVLEAQALTGENGAEAAAEALVYAGVKRVFVSDGASGMVAAHGLDMLRFPCCPATVVNSTGGGDAAMAALCRSFSLGWDIFRSARYALAAGAIAVECRETINPALSHQAVCRRMAAD
ncbi:MAG: carbohydrate kinase family protein [Oscillospiraceae bacterium]